MKSYYFIQPTVALTVIAGIIIAVTLILALQSFDPREPYHPITCHVRLKQMSVALILYATDHDGNSPPDGMDGLNLLRVKEYLPDASCYICPESGTPPALPHETLDNHCDYLFFGNFNPLRDSLMECPVAVDAAMFHGNAIHVLYAAGHIEKIRVPSSPVTERNILEILIQKASDPRVREFLESKRQEYT